MDIEFEATYTNIDKEVVRKKIKKAGAKLIKPEFLQTRVIINPPEFLKNIHAWLRLRDEGDQVTLTYKIIDGAAIEDQKEICIKVDNFKKTLELLQKLGCQVKAYQESKRELWILDGVDICIDEWPYLPPFVEVEGKNELEVKNVSKKIGFNFQSAIFGNSGTLYKEAYGIEPHLIHEQIPRLTFSDPNPFIKNE
jgi:adenylate cyclase class 2